MLLQIPISEAEYAYNIMLIKTIMQMGRPYPKYEFIYKNQASDSPHFQGQVTYKITYSNKDNGFYFAHKLSRICNRKGGKVKQKAVT